MLVMLVMLLMVMMMMFLDGSNHDNDNDDDGGDDGGGSYDGNDCDEDGLSLLTMHLMSIQEPIGNASYGSQM
jgi:hypothetical protein